MFHNSRYNLKKELLISSDDSSEKNNRRRKYRRAIGWISKVQKFWQAIKKTKWLKIIMYFIVFSVAGFVFFAIFSSFFLINEINLARNNSFADIGAMQSNLKNFYGKNLIFINHKSIKDQIKKSFNEVKSIKMSEKFPRKINITIEIWEPSFVISNENNANFTILTENGAVISNEGNEYSFLPVIKLFQYTDDLVAHHKFLSPEAVSQFANIEKQINEEFKSGVVQRSLFFAAQEFHLKLENGTNLWFDLKVSFEKQLNKLRKIKDSQDTDRSSLKKIATLRRLIGSKKLTNSTDEKTPYIDLRIPGKIFWKR